MKDSALLTRLKPLALIYIAYLGFCVFFLLPVLNFGAPLAGKKYLDRDLSADFIYFNPFNLGLVVYGARLPNRDGSDFVGLHRAEVNLSLESIYRKGLVLDVVSVAELNGHIERLDNGEFTFQDLIESEPDPQQDTATSEVFPLTIHHLALDAQRIELTDHDREQPFTTHWDNLELEVDFLSTVFDDGHPYQLSVHTEDGGEIAWEGELSLPSAFSAGTLRISALDLRPAARFVAPWVDFALADGHLSVAGRYELDWSGEIKYRISEGVVSLSGLQIVPAEGVDLPDTLVGLEALELQGISVDGPARSIEVEQLSLTGPRVEGYSEGAEASLQALFDMSGLPGGEAEQPALETEESGPEWRATLQATGLQNGTIAWRSEFTDPELTRIDGLELQLGALQWPPASPTSVSTALRVNDQASLQLDGAMHLDSGDGDFSFEVAGLQVPWFSPLVPDAFQADIGGGEVATRGSVTLAGFTPGLLELDGEISEFNIRIHEAEDQLTGWQALHWRDLSVNLEKQHVTLQTLRLDQYKGRVHIFADGSVNTSRVLREELEKAEVDTDAAAEAAVAWWFDVESVQLTDSQVDFMDESLPIPFRTIIGDLNGEVIGLSSNPNRIATVDIRGSVDGYAPVILEGTVKPVVDNPALDLSLSFEGMDLPRLTPYSGTYAGYAIDRGTMNVNLQYTLDGTRLKGDNKVVIDQLKLGDKVDSEKALDVPLELGIALLTDANGVIDVAVPVEGDVNDPGFALSGIIAKAFINLITKAVTAPFSLLANLVGTDEDLQRINFPAGSADPDEHARQTLGTLAEAMAQRPALRLVIMGRINPELDRELLQKDQLRQSLLTEGLPAEDVESKGPAWEEAITQRYRQLAPPDETEPPSITQQYRLVVAAIPVDDATLQTLAGNRAAEAKRILVNDYGLEAGRAAVETAHLEDEAHSFSGVELDIDD